MTRGAAMAVMADRTSVSSLASTSAFSARTRRTARRRGTTHSGSKLAFNSNVVVTTPPSWGCRSGHRSGCGPGMRLHTGVEAGEGGFEPPIFRFRAGRVTATPLAIDRNRTGRAGRTRTDGLVDPIHARCQAAPLPDGLDGEI